MLTCVSAASQVSKVPEPPHPTLILLTVPGNPFTILDYDVPAPSIPPLAQFSFEHPLPSRSPVLPDEPGFGISPPLDSSTSPERPAVIFPLERAESWDLGQPQQSINSSELNVSIRPRAWSPALPSIPNSPPLSSRVQLPEDSTSQGRGRTPQLNDVEIPSPLLYHKDGHSLFALQDDRIGGDLLNTFDLTRPSSADTKMQESMQTDAAFRNVPQPPWVLPSRQTSPAVTPPDTGIPEPPHLESKTFSSSLVDPEVNYSHLGTPMDLTTMPSERRETSAKSLRLFNFIEDDPKTVERMWVAFEAAVSHSTALDESSSWSFSPRDNQSERKTAFPTMSCENVDIASCPTSACTALVPARLFHQKYTNWPQQSMQVERENVLSLVGAIPHQMPRDSLLTKWFYEAGLTKDHVRGCQHATNRDTTLTNEKKQPQNDTVVKEIFLESEDRNNETTPTVQAPEHDSAYESASEIMQEDAQWSDDEWADFDWDEDTAWKFEDEDMDDSAGETAWDEVHRRLA